jgi:hypothetical protein
MNPIIEYYFTLHFTFTAAIKSLQAWHLVNAGLHNWGGGVSYNQTCMLQYVHTVHSLSEIACCEGQTHTLAQTTIIMTYHVWKQNITKCLWYLKPSHQNYCIHTSPIRHILHAGNNQYIVYTGSGRNTWRFCKTVVSGTVGMGKFVLERSSSETQSISVVMEHWSVENWAFAVETYF